MTYEDYKIHPLADAFPLIEDEEFEELCQSIDEHGLLEPIVMQDGVLIDGRNRLRACLVAGVEPRFEEYGEALEIPEYIWSKNAQRRHLEADQRAMAATAFLDYEEAEAQKRRLEALDAQKANEARWHPESADVCTDGDAEDDGGNFSHPVGQKSVQQDEAPSHHPTAHAIAERASVSRYKAEQAIAVKRYDDEHGTDLGKQVSKGEVKLKDAVKVAKPATIRNTMAFEWNTQAEIKRVREFLSHMVNKCPDGKRAEFTHELEELFEEVQGGWIND